MVTGLPEALIAPTILRVVVLFLIPFLYLLATMKRRGGMWVGNIAARFLGWLLIIPSYMAAVIFGQLVAYGVILLYLCVAFWEIKRMLNWDFSVMIIAWFVGGFGMVVGITSPDFFKGLPLLFLLIAVLLGFWRNHEKQSWLLATQVFITLCWIAYGLLHFLLMAQLNRNIDDSLTLMVLLGFAVPLSDIGAYVVGRTLSQVPAFATMTIAERLSPRKTFPGVLGNILGAWVGIALSWFAIGDYIAWQWWILIGIIMGIAGVMGDIAVSMLKRYANAKDSSTLIPGHGGVLDRIDSMVSVVIVVYYLLLLFLG